VAEAFELGDEALGGLVRAVARKINEVFLKEGISPKGSTR